MAEVGAGIGTFSQRILDAGAEHVLLMEPDEGCAAALHERFRSNPRVSITQDELPAAPSLTDAQATFDFVMCQNVLEHIEDDVAALATMAEALTPGGQLALLVPAHPELFGTLDRTYGHHRRYDLTPGSVHSR